MSTRAIDDIGGGRHYYGLSDSFSLPHARGGVSDGINPPRFYCVSSPRSWGCFLDTYQPCNQRRVFPTLVGVFPADTFSMATSAASSPRSWGCFQ